MGRAVLATRGVDLPVPQYPIPWDPSRRFDGGYPDDQVAIEWDSRLWHSKQQAMTADRRRDRMAARHGWVVLRFTWEDVTQRPDEVADTVTAVLEARRGVRP
jgi:very-short-patch-repair endonuclease